MTVWVGTSGWQYASWRGGLYPDKLPQRLWLELYVEGFDVVEVNNTFYNLPAATTFSRWRERTPSRFRFVLKLSRYLSHIKRLADPEEPVTRFLDRSSGLGDRIGPLLLQLPPKFSAEPARLAATLQLLPATVRIAVEVRDSSWLSKEILDILRRHRAPLVLTDRGEKMLEPEWTTADWGYIRLHEGT